ncbi:unnamed protein product [Ascophyllum nodosum]
MIHATKRCHDLYQWRGWWGVMKKAMASVMLQQLVVVLTLELGSGLAWVSPHLVKFQRRGLDALDGRYSKPCTSSFRGQALSLAYARDGEDQGGDGAGGGARGLVAAVRFFPNFKRKRRAAEEIASPLYRSADQIEKLTRLPVWPVQNGLFFTLLDFLRLREIALRLEDLWGGRVGTLITSNPRATDPFVLLAHHRHSFWPLDPFRLASSLIIPEGFPAHPHRGFQTVTYVMRGGMTHRDSMGIKQQYGAGQVQWMSAGRGILHEEMWDVDDWSKTDVEIYQIWVNLPSELKMTRPRLQVAGRDTEYPLPIVRPSKGTEVVVVAGELCDEVSPVETLQPLSMLHVTMKPGAETWAHRVPWGHRCMIYVRHGELTLVPTVEGYYEGEEDREPQVVRTGHAVFLAHDGDYARFENRGNDKTLDFMLIEAQPTGENVAMRGSMVMNTEKELDQARADFMRGYFGQPWDHRLSDDEWREAVQGSAGKRKSFEVDQEA